MSTAKAFNEARALIVEWATSRPFKLYAGDTYQLRVTTWLHQNPVARDDYRDAEFDALERSLAYEHAAGTIEMHCENPRDPEDEEEYLDGWLDISSAEADLAREGRYLAGRGLLERCPDNPNWVHILDEDDPLPVPAERVGE